MKSTTMRGNDNQVTNSVTSMLWPIAGLLLLLGGSAASTAGCALDATDELETSGEEEASVSGSSYFAAPGGSGSACTQNKPCSLGGALSKAASGDEVVLLDGIYNTSFKTERSGVVIRAKNTHAAVLRSTSSKRLALIEHAKTTVRGIRFDGKPTIDEGKGALVVVRASDVVIERNLIENSHAAGVSVNYSSSNAAISNVVIRHNLIQETGFSGPGEAVYVGSAEGGPKVDKVQIYGNTLRRFTQNGIDLKPNTRNADVHHNIFEGQHYKPNPFKPGNEGTIVTTAETGEHRVHDNIFRDNPIAGPATIHFAARGGNKVYKNVAFNGAGKNAIGTRIEGSGTPTEVTGNTFCKMSSYSVANPDGMNVHDNPGIPGGAPQSKCDAEESRILAEMKDLL